MCLIAGSPNVRRLAVTRRHGSAGRYRAGRVCSIAWSSTIRLSAVIRRAGSAGRLLDGHSVLGCWDATICRAGGGPPAGICWAQLGGHSVLVRWERVDSQARYQPPLLVVCFSGRRRTPARPRLGAPNSVLECCGPRAESVARPAGPAERRGKAGQSAGWVPGGAWCQAPSRSRQVRGTDSKGTSEPGRPVAGLGSLL